MKSFSIDDDTVAYSMLTSGFVGIATSEEMTADEVYALYAARPHAGPLVVSSQWVYEYGECGHDEKHMTIVRDFCRLLATIIRQHLYETMRSRIAGTIFDGRDPEVTRLLDQINWVSVKRSDDDTSLYGRTDGIEDTDVAALEVLGVDVESLREKLAAVKIDLSKNPVPFSDKEKEKWFGSDDWGDFDF